MASKTNTQDSPTPTTPEAETTPTPEAAPKTPKTKTPKEPRFVALDAQRAAWVAKHARPAIAECLCGCGGTTKGRFVPGHDATLKEQLKAGKDKHSKAALATFGW